MNIEEKIDLDMRLAKLEKSRENHRERLDNHFDFWRELREKIDKLETQQKYDHSNLVHACGRIEEIEKKLNYQQDAISQLNDIVTSNCTFKDHNTCKDKIDKLENYIKEYNEIVLGACPIEIEKLNRKKPHKCPVCDGTQRDYFDMLYPYSEYPEGTQIDHEGRKYKICGACEGKGIVWR